MKTKDSKCKQCGHEWRSRIGKPLSCPRCKRYDWNKPKEKKQ
jgi:predicted Zn-ribbon and HTH transcriptional regulator